MMKHEFEKLIGRQIPNSLYMEIEEQYMKSEKSKNDFAAEWTTEKMDSLICAKFFEMEMAVVEAEGKAEGYRSHIQKYQESAIRDRERINNLYYDREKISWQICEKDAEIEKLQNEIQNLKANLYDKGIGKGA